MKIVKAIFYKILHLFFFIELIVYLILYFDVRKHVFKVKQFKLLHKTQSFEIALIPIIKMFIDYN